MKKKLCSLNLPLKIQLAFLALATVLHSNCLPRVIAPERKIVLPRDVHSLRCTGKIKVETSSQNIIIPAGFIINATSENMRIDFLNPLGMVEMVLISTQDKGTFLVTSDGQIFRWESAESFFEEAVGIPLNPSSIYQIITGKFLSHLSNTSEVKKQGDKRCSISGKIFDNTFASVLYNCRSGMPERVKLFKKGLKITAENYTILREFPYPSLIKVETPEAFMQIKIESLEINPELSPDLFSL